jgi:hypothetical protein
VIINEYPELAEELPTLLAEFGTVTQTYVGLESPYVSCEIFLHNPAKVMRHSDNWNTVSCLNLTAGSHHLIGTHLMRCDVRFKLSPMPQRAVGILSKKERP